MLNSANNNPLISSGAYLPVFVVLSLIVSVFIGFTVALFGSSIGIALGGLVIAVAILTAPRIAVWGTIIGGLAIAGLVELYFPAFQIIRWAFAVLSIVLAIISILKWAFYKNKVASTQRISLLWVMLALFFLAVLLSAVAGRLPVSQAVVGLKNYFQMWGLMLALAWFGYKPIEAKRFISFLGLLALIQIPFVLHQFLILVPMRSGAVDAARNIVAVDIVAGTFGGDMGGGGRSADLAVLVALSVTLFFAQWKAGFRRLGITLALAALAFVPILLNEAKLALVLIPLGLLILFRQTIVERPFSWLLGTTVMATCMAMIVVIYSMLPGAASQKSKSLEDFMSSSIEYNIGDRGYGSSLLNRSTVYRFWWVEHNRTGDLMHAFLGHGPGFSNTTAIRQGNSIEASRYLGYTIGLTGFSTLLWDTGLVGTGIFIMLLYQAFRLAQRLTMVWANSEHEPFIRTAQIGVIMLGTSMLHNEYIAFDIGFQTMFSVIIGYIFAMARVSMEKGS